MKKRIFSIILTLCMVLPFVPTTVFAANTFGDFEYSVSDTNEVTITKYNGRGGAVEIPDKIDGRTVTAIGDNAFKDCTSLKNVTIPNGVKSIRKNAFLGCTSLTSITIPNSVTSIGNNAFNNCRSLTSIEIPGSVQTIEWNAFFYCSRLTSITIQPGVENIEIGAFQNCENLTSINIPSSVTSIGNDAFNNVFNGCKSLTSIKVDDSNTAYSSVDGVLFNKDKTILIKYPEGKTGNEYSIPDSVKSIRKSAFLGCTSLTSITIPNSVTSIGDGAFYRCTSLTSITIPNGVTSIGNNVFEECVNLTSIEIPNSVTSIGDNAFDRYNLNSIFLPDKDNLTIGTNAIPGTASQVKYSLENGKATITGIVLGTYKTSIAIPETICGYPVVAIADTSLLNSISSHTHVGGQATCNTKAICAICGNKYGEFAHNLEKIPAKDASVTATGNKEYWHCKDCGKYFSDKDGKNSIELKDTVIQKLLPEIIEGKEQSITTGEKKYLTFRSNAAFSDFIKVELDGKTLDEKNYTVKEGSTVVTLKADYVATLSEGKHTISIVSTSGTATTTFKINAKTTVDNNTKPTQTGDNSHMALWIALLFVSGGILIDSKKKKYN